MQSEPSSDLSDLHRFFEVHDIFTSWMDISEIIRVKTLFAFSKVLLPLKLA